MIEMSTVNFRHIHEFLQLEFEGSTFPGTVSNPIAFASMGEMIPIDLMARHGMGENANKNAKIPNWNVAFIPA